MSVSPLRVSMAIEQRVKRRWIESQVRWSGTHEQVLASRRLIERSWNFLLHSRHKLSGGAASPDDGLRQQLCLALASGALFLVDSKSWVGPGSGRGCVVCSQPVVDTDVEHEVDGPDGPVVAHQQCYLAWFQESEARRAEAV